MAIVDAKMGLESSNHVVQVMIYLYAIPRALERYRAAKLRGQVTYRDHTVRIPRGGIDNGFIEDLGTLIRRVSAVTPPQRVPSFAECPFCDIMAADCPDRVEGCRELEGTIDDF